MTVWSRIRGHLSEYVARYSVLALAVLTPAAGLLGTLAADLGGADTPLGRALLAAASALGVAAAGVVFIRNLGVWQMLDRFGTAEPPAREVKEAANALEAIADRAAATAEQARERLGVSPLAELGETIRAEDRAQAEHVLAPGGLVTPAEWAALEPVREDVALGLGDEEHYSEPEHDLDDSVHQATDGDPSLAAPADAAPIDETLSAPEADTAPQETDR